MATTKMQQFTGVGPVSFVPPANVSVILITMAGGGGAAGGYDPAPSESNGCSGGGGGEFMRRVPLHVTPGVAVSGVVGAGGPRGNYTGSSPNGSASSFGPYICLGGYGGERNDSATVGTAGAGYKALRLIGSNFALTDGDRSNYEYDSWNAGASGGGQGSNGLGVSGHLGGPCEGHVAATGGSTVNISGTNRGGGSGGAAGGWGPGGNGGDGDQTGNDAPAGSYGAGGGGGGPHKTSGAGMSGYILIEWQGP
jgi:hypothetical protein